MEKSKHKKTIAIVSPWTLPTVGGTQKLVDGLARGLVKDGRFEVIVMTAVYPDNMHGLVDQSKYVCLPYKVERFPFYEKKRKLM